jgi:hypothetical protein
MVTAPLKTMRLSRFLFALVPATILSFVIYPAAAQTGLNEGFALDSRQPIDQAYTDHIRKYTTIRSSPLVCGLPASFCDVPTPAKVLGDLPGLRTCFPTPRMFTSIFISSNRLRRE